MKINWKTLIICIFIPLFIGGVAGFISKDSMAIFENLTKPPLSPPGWLFPVVWTILYILMGIASYLIVTSSADKKEINRAIKFYVLQLFFNFLWTYLFFNLQLYTISFIWLLALWILIFITIVSFYRISKTAAYLLIPYLLWVSYAGYLNLGIAVLN